MNIVLNLVIVLFSLITAGSGSNSSLQPSSFNIGKGIVDGNYIGGMNAANIKSFPVFKSNISSKVVKVKNKNEFLNELKVAKNGSIIYLMDDVTFDLTGLNNIKIPADVTIMSGRGVNRSKGALIYTTSLTTLPLFSTSGANVKMMGLRLKGPDGNVINPILKTKFLTNNFEVNTSSVYAIKGALRKKLIYGIGNSRGIEVNNKEVLIQNCEIYDWSAAGISIKPGGDAEISYCFIHDNQRLGLGYGITHNQGTSLIKANIFKNNRHGIAGTGAPGTSYSASYNIFLMNDIDQGHQIDMHGGKDRGERNNIAGDDIKIFNNIIFRNNNPAILIRGNPQRSADIYDNLIVNSDDSGLMDILQKGISNSSINLINDSKSIKQTNGKSGMKIRNNTFLK